MGKQRLRGSSRAGLEQGLRPWDSCMSASGDLGYTQRCVCWGVRPGRVTQRGLISSGADGVIAMRTVSVMGISVKKARLLALVAMVGTLGTSQEVLKITLEKNNLSNN